MKSLRSINAWLERWILRVGIIGLALSVTLAASVIDQRLNRLEGMAQAFDGLAVKASSLASVREPPALIPLPKRNPFYGRKL
jgi:hypothetical protein